MVILFSLQMEGCAWLLKRMCPKCVGPMRKIAAGRFSGESTGGKATLSMFAKKVYIQAETC